MRIPLLLLLTVTQHTIKAWYISPRSGIKIRRRPSSHLRRIFGSTTKTTVDKSSSTSICSLFSDHIVPIRLEGENDNFLAKSSVPSYAFNSDGVSPTKIISESKSNEITRVGLEAVVPGTFVLKHVLSTHFCEELINTCEEASLMGKFESGKNHHGAMQLLVSKEMSDAVFKAIARFVEPTHRTKSKLYDEDHSEEEEWTISGLNRRWRVYRYQQTGNESFAPHIDAGFPPSGLSNGTLIFDDSKGDDIVSRLTVLMYLNDDFVGGQTKFYTPSIECESSGLNEEEPSVIAAVKPEAGSLLIFPLAVGEKNHEYARLHWPTHEGSAVLGGNRGKYVIRSDVLFTKIAAEDDDDADARVADPFSQYDSDVRNVFLPTSPVYDSNFLSHLEPLYNPHMGVECAGPLLHSFIRFTKVRRVVEIGAGYTSLWILQALKDNDDEFTRIRALQREDKCRLMNWPWTVPNVVETFDSVPSSLLCIDNCAHQKETATGAAAVARTLGLDPNFEFIEGDAFDMNFEEDSCDLLWCDFGVGARMKDFASSAWKCIRPGGYLVCHSTLTNQRTRDWLEAVRGRESEKDTGLPEGEFVEVSFLEPHKHYQNSLSILQRRPPGRFAEPLYSEYA